MPLQIIPQQNQPVGLQLLGDTIAGAATDYANKRRQDDLMALQRADKLSDIASVRNYEDQRFDKVRNLQLDDEQRKRTESFDDAKKRAEYDRRLAMLTEAERRGIFDARQIGNTVAEEAALTALQTQLAKEAKFAQEQPGNAQARLEQLDQIESGLTQKLAAIDAVLSKQATVDPARVAQRAVVLATQANGGNTPTKEQIIAAQDAAYKEAEQAAMVQDYQEKEAARVQAQLYAPQLNAVRQERASLINAFKVAPRPSTASLSTPPPGTPTPPRGAGDPKAGFIAALDELMAKQRMGSGGGTAGAASNLQNIRDLSMAEREATAENKPVYRQAKTGLLAGEYERLDRNFDPQIATASAELAAIDKELEAVKNGTPPFQATSALQYGDPFGARNAAMAPTYPASPEAQASMMTNLLVKRAAAERKLQESRALKTGGKTSLLSTIPAANSPFSYSPNTALSPGALVSGP